MKFPSHIILDIKNSSVTNSSQYWIYKYIFFLENPILNFETLTFHRKFLLQQKPNFKFFNVNSKNYTLKYNLSHPIDFASTDEKKFANKFFTPRPKVKHKTIFNNFLSNQIYTYEQLKKNLIDEKFLILLFKNFKFKNTQNIFKTNLLWTLFDINFLRKEKIYTKLKYSRVPQYDIVSGGVAALFSGFLGFLICEKFGFELIDSGDFYILFMYVVFLSFALRLFLRITTHDQLSWNALSLKWFFLFYKNLLILIFKKIKQIINEINIIPEFINKFKY